ncbi:hypothetical protein HK413_07245 [Mucilaginibacter sp. S1162]|uniref:DUF4625 domain-containing protein n=1 Tax=Mucilaginibacter humi TaxID=2732510 RepID=A0ABX1W2C3_9SPHI|nr:hypothetical protein [Mucilaginibacter humi]NNU34004.1 hypothetical protein [Mucilaginibacter humi]
MKKIFLPLILVFFAATVFSQKVVSVKTKDPAILLSSVEALKTASDDNIAIKVYKIANVSGSAHVLGTDEVSHRFLISVSSIDDAPEVHLYNVGDFYAPKILGLTKVSKGVFKLSIEYDAPRRKWAEINITLKNVTLINRNKR